MSGAASGEAAGRRGGVVHEGKKDQNGVMQRVLDAEIENLTAPFVFSLAAHRQQRADTIYRRHPHDVAARSRPRPFPPPPQFCSIHVRRSYADYGRLEDLQIRRAGNQCVSHP